MANVTAHVQSQDGTDLLLERYGDGPPLVLVHGAGPAALWYGLLPYLQDHTSVYIMHRRGWEGSGDTLPYSLAREAEDLLAVLTWIGEPVTLVGASFGGRCVLEAVLRGPPYPGRLLVNEPSMRMPNEDAVYAQAEALVAAGRREDAVVTFLRGVTRLSDAEIARRRGLPEWSGRVATIHLAVRGGRAVQQTPFPLARLATIQIPTLLLVGGESTPAAKPVMQQLAATLPQSQLVQLAGQGHFAVQTAPEMYARALLAFVTTA